LIVAERVGFARTMTSNPDRNGSADGSLLPEDTVVSPSRRDRRMRRVAAGRYDAATARSP